MKFLRETALISSLRQIQTTENRSSVLTSFRPFRRDIYRTKLMTPHEEMESVLDAKDSNTFFESAIQTATDFIIGEKIVVKSEDKFSKKTVEQWLWDTKFELALREVITQTIATGNSYLEQDFLNPQTTNGVLIPNKFYVIPDPSMIYINSDEYGKPLKIKQVQSDGSVKEVDNFREYYIQRINQNIKQPGARYYYLSYYGSGNYAAQSRYQIYGIPLDKRKIIHFKLNYGNTGLYGRSQLASALTDAEMLYEIERSIAVLAKYKAVPRKIWSLGNKEMPATEDEIDNFVYYLESLDKEDDAWSNKPVSAVDMSYSGGEMNLDYAINHIKKKMIAGVSLDFLSGMGQDVNRATAQQELLAFILSIYSKRKVFLRQIQEEIIDKYVKYKQLKPVIIEFSNLEFETLAEKESRIRSNWMSNMITYNEMREEIGKPTDDSGKGDKLSGELQIEFQSAFLGGIETQSPELNPPNNNTFGEIGNNNEKLYNQINNMPIPEGYNLGEIEVNIPEDAHDKIKNITWDTLVRDFMFLFNETNPRGTEIYYKRIPNGYEISFNQNGILIKSKVSFTNIANYYGAVDEVSVEKLEELIAQFENNFLRNAIEEV